MLQGEGIAQDYLDFLGYLLEMKKVEEGQGRH